MKSRDRIVIGLLSVVLIGYGARPLLSALFSGRFIQTLLEIPVFFGALSAIESASIAAGIGLWFRKPWARWLAVGVVGLMVLVVVLLTASIFHSVCTQPSFQLPLTPELTASVLAKMMWDATADVAVGSGALVLLLSRHMGKAMKPRSRLCEAASAFE